uniref:Uncharacterized protein n=1 Tax=Strigamia maritima TaxID=126957 RepID=T1ISJ4_STRMM
MLRKAPGFFRYHLERDPTRILSRNNELWYNCHENVVDFFNDERNLLRSKVQSWIQPLDFKKPETVKNIERRQNGPAFTYYITLNNGSEIDVDLVPVIRLPPNYAIPDEIFKSDRFKELRGTHKHVWVMVPKKHSTTSANVKDTFWRLSFPEAEKNLLPKDGCVKTLIKLFKLFRDAQEWEKLPSYYIKTLFLLELDTCANTDWPQEQMGKYFMKMMNKLKIALETKELYSYFNRSANLLTGLDPSITEKYAKNIQDIIKEISANPKYDIITSYFTITPKTKG